MNVGSLLVAHAQSSKLVEPGEAPLYNPAPTAEASTVLRIAHREQREDPTTTQTSPD